VARTLVRWDPFTEIANMRSAFDRMFDETFPRLVQARNGEDIASGSLGIDVYETPEEMVVKAAVPGVDPNDVDISVEEDVLTIRGDSRHESEVKEENYLRRELRYGSFGRSLRLPPTVDPDNASATFEHGILKLTFPKKPEAKARSIKITPRGVIEGEQGESQS
jgi:HSP20 family protein